jgi:hypothetical protein
MPDQDYVTHYNFSIYILGFFCDSYTFSHASTPLLRWLSQSDPLRRGYGTEGPPAPRTHARACAEAHLSASKPHETWEKDKKHVRLTTGINHWCPLSVLSKFDMIWDFCPDMMHIIKTFFERLVLGVFSGSRKPNYSNPKPAPLPKDPSAQEKKNSKTRCASTKPKRKSTRKKSGLLTSATSTRRLGRLWTNVSRTWWATHTGSEAHWYVTNIHNILGFMSRA